MSQLERLAKPIPPKYVKPPAQGMFGNYVDHEIINQILLKVCGPFSFEVQQVFYNPDGLIDGCTASLTLTIDGREITITEAGGCAQAAHSKSQGDRLKKAASDALKRCAMRTSLALHVWAGDQDYFLYEQLKNSGVHAEDETSRPSSPPSGVAVELDGATSAPVASAPDTRATPAGGANAGPEEPPPVPSGPAISKNRVQQLQSKLAAMIADGIKGVADARIRQGLPKLTEECSAEELDGWADLLNRMDPNVAREAV